MSKKTAKQL